MALNTNVTPPPNNPVSDDPVRDAIYRRWFEQISALIQQINGSGVVGPGSSTDNAIARWNGTSGQLLQNSGVIIDDSNSITGVSSFSAINGLFSGAVSSATLNVTSDATINGSLTVTSLAAARVVYTGASGLMSVNEALQYASATSTFTATNISTIGTLTVGNAAGDTLIFNAGTWTINNNYIATRAVGAADAGVNTLQQWITTFTGDAGGTSDIRGTLLQITLSGANDATQVQGGGFDSRHSGAGLVTNITGFSGTARVTSSGSATNSRGFLGATINSGSGTITTAANFIAIPPTLSSTGTFVNHYGFYTQNIGHATLITNAVGFQADNMTAAATLTAAFRSAMASGTGKWGFLAVGTANNAFNGNVRVGSTVAPTVALDVTGTAAISGGISLNTASKVSAYTYTGSDYAIYANASGAAFTLTVPHASSLPNKIFVAKKIDSSGNAVTVSSVSNIDGATTTSLAAQFTKIMFQSDGTQWFEI